MNGLIEMDAGNPVCLLFILLSLLSSPLLPTSFLSSGLLYWPLFLSEALGRDVCMRSTQRQCHFFISRASSPFFCFPDRYPTRKLIFHCPPSCRGPLTRLCLGPSVQGCAQDPTTPVCCTIFGLSFSALSSEISVVAGVYFLVLLFFPPPPPSLFISHHLSAPVLVSVLASAFS